MAASFPKTETMNTTTQSNKPPMLAQPTNGSFIHLKLWSELLLVISTVLAPAAAPSATIELRAPTDQASAYFGSSMLGLADLTGDGMGELAVGAFGYNGAGALGYIGDGAVFILNGRDFSLVRQIHSPNPNGGEDSGSFGWSLAETSDASGDGVPELIVGAIYADRPNLLDAGFGQAYVIDPTTGASLQTLSAPRPRRNTRFGWNVASLPTKTAGQVTRIAVGAPSAPVGQVHLYDAVTGELISTFGAPAPKSGDWFGASLAAIGDVDGDGRVDLAVGAGGEDNGLNSSPGAAYLVSGETGKLLYPLIPPDLPAITRHRWSVAGVPDVNGDGKTDVLVGVPLASPLGELAMAGRAYLFSGGDGRWLRTVVSPEPQARGFFGWAVAGLPDITGDGVAELLISAAARPSVGSLGERRMHLMNGATGQRIETFKSLSNGESFGFSITGMLDRAGKLRTIASGAAVEPPPPAPSRAGRAYAFPLSLSFVSVAMSGEGIRVSVTATDDKSYNLQASSDLAAWTTLTTLNAAVQPVTFVDKAASATGQRFYRAQRAAP